MAILQLPVAAEAATGDLVVALTAGGTGTAGLDLSLTARVDNVGDGPADDVTVTITVPATMPVASARSSAGGCQEEAGAVTCEPGTVAAGEHVTVDLTVTPTQAGPAAVDAAATGTGADPTPDDNMDQVSVAVDGPSCQVVGTQERDTLEALPGGSVVCGLGGRDALVGGPGDDVLVGGSGIDRATFAGAEGPVTASLAGGTAGGHGDDLLVAIEHLTGGPSGDHLTGNAGGNILRGGGGGDTLEGRRGPDVLAGGPGPDTLKGGKGRDRATFAGAGKGVVVDLGPGTATGEGADALRGIEDVTGSAHDDVLIGSGAPNRLRGLGGRDVLRGEGAKDRLFGGPGPDSLVGGARRDRLDGGGGTDGCLQGVGKGTKRRCEVLAWSEAPDVALFVPSRSLVGIGFHQSLFGSAVALRPHGKLHRNDHGGFTAPAPTDGPGYAVMGSRGRGTPATSAADLVVGSHTKVTSPVHGVVTRVRRYLLYCHTPDWQVLIRPAGRPDLVVMVLHLASVHVSKGDRVAAGVTGLGKAAGNDAASAQANAYFPDQHPHVHIEVERDGAKPIPGCPL
ncbi:MAG: hypothetical protein ACRDI0_06535 [Actinomycetota bacterium]